MADIFTKSKRSEVMSAIRGRGNEGTELALIKILRNGKFNGWRRHYHLYGNPDFVFPKVRVAVFVDGCFWHGCPRCYKRPKSNQNFWDKKFQKNRRRDRQVNQKLAKLGWKKIRIWEHQLKNPQSIISRIHKILLKENN